MMSKKQFLAENLKDGEIYAGLILGKDGERDYHLFLRPEKPKKILSWLNAMKWAQSIGFVLPNCRELSLLFTNCRDEFEKVRYWSGEQYARNYAYAWVQNFLDGYQNDFRNSSEYRARAVRRFYIKD